MSLRDKVLSILQNEANNDSFGLTGGAREDSEWFKLVKKYGVKKAKEMKDAKKKAPAKKMQSEKKSEWQKCIKRHKTAKEASKYYKDGICHETMQAVEQVAVAVVQNPTPNNIQVLIEQVVENPETLQSPVVQEVINRLPEEVREEIKQEIRIPEYEKLVNQQLSELAVSEFKPKRMSIKPDTNLINLLDDDTQERKEVENTLYDAVSKGVRELEKNEYDFDSLPAPIDTQTDIEKFKEQLINEIDKLKGKISKGIVKSVIKNSKFEYGGCMDCGGKCGGELYGGEYDEYDDDFYEGGYGISGTEWGKCVSKHKGAKNASKYYNKATKKCGNATKEKKPLTEWNKCVQKHGLALAKLYYDKKTKTCKPKKATQKKKLFK